MCLNHSQVQKSSSNDYSSQLCVIFYLTLISTDHYFVLFYYSTVNNFNQNYKIFNLYTNLDTFRLCLYSRSHHPEDDHMRGQNMLLAATQ